MIRDAYGLELSTDSRPAVDAYDRANAHQRKGDEPAADRALDEGLAAIGSAQERLAGRKPR